MSHARLIFNVSIKDVANDRQERSITQELEIDDDSDVSFIDFATALGQGIAALAANYVRSGYAVENGRDPDAVLNDHILIAVEEAQASFARCLAQMQLKGS